MATIALVDDDENILTSVSIALEAEGYHVTWAARNNTLCEPAAADVGRVEIVLWIEADCACGPEATVKADG